MNCSKCGANVETWQRYCSSCGRVANQAQAGEPTQTGVYKGNLLAKLKPPFDLFGRFRITCIASLVALVWLLEVSLDHHWAAVAIGSAGVLFCAGIFLANRAYYLSISVRVYENGLEIDVPRTWDKCLYLSWDRIDSYRFEKDTLCYSWSKNALAVSAGRDFPFSRPLSFFPNKLKVTNGRLLALLHSLLEEKTQGKNASGKQTLLPANEPRQTRCPRN